MQRVLVTGATGYVGGRLVPRLLERGYRVRVLARAPRKLDGRPWRKQVEVVQGDLLKTETLGPALEGVEKLYYLVHSMYGGADFQKWDRQAAENLTQAGKHLKLVVYLGGLLPDHPEPSAHLASRAEVGEILRRQLPTTEFRAGPIIGSGSASFEMVRYLTERLPVMIAPKWIKNEVQPIAIRDVLAYLLDALEKPALDIVEIGADRLAFREMMHGYAASVGLKRTIFAVPVLAPRLAARWVGFVTPISNDLAVPLVDGIMHPLHANTTLAKKEFPDIKPLEYRPAVDLALSKVRQHLVETRWDSGPDHDGDVSTFRHDDWAGLIREVRSVWVPVEPKTVFTIFSGLGGDRGWPAWEWAWRLRGALDKLAGGPGLRRGRRHPDHVMIGEALDFWRVEEIDPPHQLTLRAEMKVPGDAWLQFRAIPHRSGTRLIQTAGFRPRGLAGWMYWYVLYPVHGMIFSDMVRAIARDSRHYQLRTRASGLSSKEK